MYPEVATLELHSDGALGQSLEDEGLGGDECGYLAAALQGLLLVPVPECARTRDCGP